MFIDASSAVEGVSLEEVARHLRIYDAAEQGVELDRIRKAARDYAERYCGRTLRTTVTRTIWYDRWPCSPIALPWPPVTSITSVKYYDVSSVDTTVASGNYRLQNPTDGKGHIYWDDDFTTPNHEVRPDAIRIAYVTGGTIPDAAKHAILMLCELFYGDDGESMAHMRQAALEARAKSLLDTLDAHIYA